MRPQTKDALARLGIALSLIVERRLIEYEEASELVVVARAEEREFLLTPAAAEAWHAMCAAARSDGAELLLLSAYRSVARQIEIIERNLNEGKTIDQVLLSVAPPGFSEHHTGRAVDIGSPDHPYLDVSFEHTSAYAWLRQHAAGYGFVLSYPEGNASGYQYEPWHWCFHPT